MMRRFAFVLALAAVAVSCAKMGYPTGGPKDEVPPQPVAVQPANESRNFDKDRFYIGFDEYVVLKNANENVLVSPPLKNKPEYTVKGKGVLVKINDTLQPNTTYLFQFKEAVADFTEGNVLPSFEYVFSTGADMDTLMLEGSVAEAKGGAPWKEAVTVMAYQEETYASDTAALSLRPSYVTRCDKSGRFAFHYIPEGRYRIVALEDKNRNLRLDASEAVAWDTAYYSSFSRKDSTARRSVLRISAPDRRKQRIVSSEFTEQARIVIATALPMQNPEIGGVAAEWRLNKQRDTLILWCLDAKADTARLVLSDPTGLQDTLKLRFRPKNAGRRRGKEETSTPIMKALCSGTAAFYDDLRLAFLNPVVKVADSAFAEVMNLKDSSIAKFPLVVDSTGLEARIVATLRSGQEYRVRLREKLFTDIHGRTSDSLVFKLTPKDYGMLTLHVENVTGSPLVIEVLDSRDTVVQKMPMLASGTLRFRHLPAADYRLRAVVDVDGDGAWTPGNYMLQRQPESTIPFGKTLQLREKWEMEERWTVKVED